MMYEYDEEKMMEGIRAAAKHVRPTRDLCKNCKANPRLPSSRRMCAGCLEKFRIRSRKRQNYKGDSRGRKALS